MRCASTRVRAEASTSSSSSGANKQVLRLVHRGRDVRLVGTMHYNPRSIELSASTVRELASKDALGALVLETCPKRWEKTLKFQPKDSIMRRILDNEFQASAEEANGAEIVLGDQEIEKLGDNLKYLVKETIADVLWLPRAVNGGWARYYEDVREAVRREINARDDTAVTTPWEFFDASLLLNVPVSLIRYPLAWLLKSPKLIVPLVTFTATLAALPDAVESISDSAQQSAAETIVTDLFLALDFLQISLLTRCFLVALLRDRNDVLAESISNACDRVPANGAVVAILGAAHLNGVHRRLRELEDDALERAAAPER